LPTFLGNGKTYETCQTAAKEKGVKLFGLQYTQPNGTSECWVGNDQAYATSLGKNNCKVLNGVSVGGTWINAVYSMTLEGLSSYLILQDDGNMCIYKGTGPTDNQGGIWCTMTNGKQQTANPTMVASKSKYGKNWMKTGDVLGPGDFISSNKGNLVLMMQDDGNLVLYTYNLMVQNCKPLKSNGKMGGGVNANAVYDIGQAGIGQNMGMLGLVDEDSNLHVYPSNNQKSQNSYSIHKNIGAWGWDLATINNSSVESCKKECNSKNDCGGFSFHTLNKTCWLKGKQMYPFKGSAGYSVNQEHYVRDRTPNTTSIGISQTTNNIDSIKYEKYLKGGPIEKNYGLSKITAVQKQQLDQMETKLNLITKQINDYTSKYNTGASIAEKQAKTNISGLNNYFTDLKKTNKNIIGVSGENQQNGIQNILTDSDIVVLQKNYDYLFWSILAVGTILVSMNIVKKE
jgi:hypothetical protein